MWEELEQNKQRVIRPQNRQKEKKNISVSERNNRPMIKTEENPRSAETRIILYHIIKGTNYLHVKYDFVRFD